MKKVLGLVGSPRNLGNCEIMVKEISARLPVHHELRLLRLSDFRIEPCRGCYACLFGDHGCSIPDDLSVVLNEMLAADAYIVASPTYFLGPTGVFKSLTDRWLALMPQAELLWGKPAVAVGVAGIEQREGYCEFGLESFLKMLYADLKGLAMVYGALPGEIFCPDGNKQVAQQLASALFGDSLLREAPACPICGGTTFRFLGGGRIRCMLCSNPGSYDAGEGEIAFRIEPVAWTPQHTERGCRSP